MSKSTCELLEALIVTIGGCLSFLSLWLLAYLL